MKKTMRILVLALAMMMALCFSAQAITQSEIEGIWDVDLKPVFAMQGIPEDQFDAFMTMIGGMTMTIEFTADQKMVMETVVAGETESQEMPYTLQGDAIVLEDGSRSVLTLNGDSLTILDPDGTEMIMTRHGAENTAVIEGNTDVVYGNSIVGVWDMDIVGLMKMNGVSDEELAQMEPLLALMTATMEFTEDGRCIITTTAMGEESKEESTYKVYGNTVEMDGTPAQYAIEGNTLTITEGEYSLVMTRNTTAEPTEPAVTPDASAASVVGVWNMDVKAVLQMAGTTEEDMAQIEPLLALMTATIEFTEDGRCIMVTTALGEEASREEMEYSIEGDIMYMNGGACQYVLDGNTLTIIGEGDGLSLTLTK